ncbi:MAG: hypothetical protein IMZ61_04700 [Planctomycetes bacterium]|nr:hypothetical protein [Planctomycetota bacterium]
MASTCIEQALDVTLRASTAWLATLTGGLYPYNAPDGATEPYAFYNVISDPAIPDSFGNIATGQARVQFDFVTATKGGKSIALAARKIIDNLQGSKDGIVVKLSDCTMVRDIALTTNSWQWQFDCKIEYVIP